VPTVSLPADPSLENLRHRARTLQRAVRAGDPEALALVARHHPAPPPAGGFPLSAAQLVVARGCGFASWPRLKHHLDVITRYRRDPDLLAAGPAPVGAAGLSRVALADDLCRLACLVYSPEDGPHRWTAARDLLAAHPDLPSAHIWAAATAADPAAVERFLAADASLANRQGGPYRWEPLFHVAYSRLDPAVPADRVLATARLLLAAGADPNAGYLWKGLPTPFTVLTGAFGEGEQGPGRQPRHPHSLALAELLLTAGANPNDAQSLYNRMFRPDDDHLHLLFAHGLGTGTTPPGSAAWASPWRPPPTCSPASSPGPSTTASPPASTSSSPTTPPPPPISSPPPTTTATRKSPTPSTPPPPRPPPFRRPPAPPPPAVRQPPAFRPRRTR
jgi:hypothetical protein